MMTELILSHTHKRFVYVCSLPILANEMYARRLVAERTAAWYKYMLPSP